MKNVCMTKKEFCEKLVDAVRESFKGFEVSMEALAGKREETEFVMNLRMRDSGFVFCLHLEEYYEAYCDDISFSHIEETITTSIDTSTIPIIVENISSMDRYERIKERTYIKVYDLDSNQEYLKDKYYSVHGSLAAIYCYKAFQNEAATYESIITQGMIEQWGLSTDIIHRDALDNMGREAVLYSVREISECGMNHARNLLRQEEEVRKGFLLLTNQNNFGGAALILNGAIMRKAAEVIGGDFYILPCSIHEVILSPAYSCLQREKIIELLENVKKNLSHVDDCLGDIPLYYHVDTRIVTLI
ncbi:MAG: DUF5688 family protein [Clostridiales bacterium]|nr:DUF5688 family protein [Clostridiales bacterium]